MQLKKTHTNKGIIIGEVMLSPEVTQLSSSPSVYVTISRHWWQQRQVQVQDGGDAGSVGVTHHAKSADVTVHTVFLPQPHILYSTHESSRHMYNSLISRLHS